MADLPSPSRDDDNFMENGRLSYENPNYKLHFDPLRLDVLNSNTDHYNINSTVLGYDMDMQLLTPQLSNMDLGLELEMALRGGQRGQAETNATRQRRNYAALDPASMGVDLNVGPVMNLGSPDFDNNRGVISAATNSEGEHTGLLKNSSVEGTSENNQESCSPVSESSSLLQPTTEESETERTAESTASDEYLPAGWEKHEDDEGPYYWHIKSGTIQREPPPRPANDSSLDGRNFQKQVIREAEALTHSASIPSVVTRSSTSFALSDLDASRAKEETAYKRRSYPVLLNSDAKDKAIRFAVRSLGWVEIAEEDLTPERSSKAVNRCIVDLSLGRNDLLDVVGRWGDGKDLFMDLDEGSLKLIDPENLTVLNSQPIHTIRVWGVGRDNGRDFAYVARDRVSRRHMCHVFRCDTPARTIANTLRDICKKIMIERSLQHSTGKSLEPGLSPTSSTARTRPNNLPTEQRRPANKIGNILSSQNFPTPMEEPRKVLRGRYVGSMKVSRPSGIDVLNNAIDELASQVPAEQWREVNISVAPSVIIISDVEDEENVLAECRVRFLSFLGIGRQVEHCAFIVHTANDVFIAHVLCCEPSSGAICKTIEAACKLRYQKCLDAHGVMRGRAPPLAESQTPTGRSLDGIGAALKSVFGSLTGKKGSRAPDS